MLKDGGRNSRHGIKGVCFGDGSGCLLTSCFPARSLDEGFATIDENVLALAPSSALSITVPQISANLME